MLSEVMTLGQYINVYAIIIIIIKKLVLLFFCSKGLENELKQKGEIVPGWDGATEDLYVMQSRNVGWWQLFAIDVQNNGVRVDSNIILRLWWVWGTVFLVSLYETISDAGDI